MQVLCDTNILVRLANPGDPKHELTLNALARLSKDGHKLVLVPQCLYEYHVVVTRPVQDNGLGLSETRAIADLDQLIAINHLMNDEPGIFQKWKSTVGQFKVIGKQAHDARLVAAMDHHGLTCLLTFNDKHFKRFTHLRVVTPGDVLNGEL